MLATRAFFLHLGFQKKKKKKEYNADYSTAM